MNTAELMTSAEHAPLHLVVEKAPFLKALAHCQGVVERRNTVPILAHVLLDAKSNGLQITATDLEIAFIEQVAAKVTQAGKATVSAHLLFDIVRKLPDGAEIELKTSEDGASLLLRSGRSKYNFSCLPVADFPLITTENFTATFNLHAAELCQLIDKTRFSMSTDETRYYLNGICLHPTSSGFLRAVATDGLRLAQAQIDLPAEAASMEQVILSKKSIYELRKLIEEVAEEVTVSLSKNQVQFVIGSSLLISRLIEGKFPEYEKVIPVNNDKVLEVNVKDFSTAVDRISIMSTDKLKPVKIHINDKVMSISAHSSEMGSASEEVEVAYAGPALSFGFNTRFILDVTQQISTEKLRILIGDETQAIIIKEESDDSALYVLMPLRV